MLIPFVILLGLLFASVLTFGGIFIVFCLKFCIERSDPMFLLIALCVVAVGYIISGVCIAAIYKLVRADSFKNAFVEYLKLLRFFPKVIFYIVWSVGGVWLMITPLACLKGHISDKSVDLKRFCITAFLAAVWLLLTVLFIKLRNMFKFGKLNAAIPAEKETQIIYAAFPVFRAHGESKYKSGRNYAVGVSAAAYYSCRTGTVIDIPVRIFWGAKSIDIDRNLKEAGFKGEGIYCLKVRALTNGDEGFLLEKVLGKYSDSEELEEIFDRYDNVKLPVSQMFGELRLDRRNEELFGVCYVKGERADFRINIDFYKPETWQDIIDMIESCFGSPEELDDRCREYILQEIYADVNEWSGESESVSQERFLERLGSFVFISVSDEWYEICYETDGMFTDHCIAVRGTFENGFEDAVLEG